MHDDAKRHARIRLAIVAVLLLGVCVVFFFLLRKERGASELSVTFFDVGQGDALLIESPTGVQMLIDGGPNASVLRVLSRELGFFDRTLDIVLATHGDLDHVGGLVDVLSRYEVSEIVMTENKGESTAAEEFFARAKNEGAHITYARRGMTYDLGGGAYLSILFPDRDPSFLESNTASIVARLTYGETEFLFTGDAPDEIEMHLVVQGIALESDVLKAGHHGSRTSTSQLFLDRVAPRYAVISAGRDNRYGHPHKEVMDRLNNAGVITKNTAEEGSITFVSDGVSLGVR